MKRLLLILSLVCSTAHADLSETSVGGKQELNVGRQDILFAERATDPATPSTDKVKIYLKDNSGTSTLYQRDSTGTVTALGGSSGALGAATASSLNLGGATGVTLSALQPGKMTIAGVGNTNNENLLIDFETTANRAIFTSGTGLSSILFTGIALTEPDDINFTIGASSDLQIQQDTAETNDGPKIGVLAGSAGGSSGNGVLGLVQNADINTNFFFPLVSDPTLRIQSSDATATTDTIQFFHDQSRARIQSGDGLLGIGGTFKTNNEDLLFDFESTSNTVGVTSGTGATNLSLNGLSMTITGTGNQSTITEGLVTNNGAGTDEDDDTRFTVTGSAVYEIDAGDGTFRSTANDAGWTMVDQTDNQACTTGCTSACLFGMEDATGAAVTGIVSCSANTADKCMCMGAS